MYYSLLQFQPVDREKLIHTGREHLAVEAARRYFATRPSSMNGERSRTIGVVSASDCGDDCQPTHIVIDGVVYRLMEVFDGNGS